MKKIAIALLILVGIYSCKNNSEPTEEHLEIYQENTDTIPDEEIQEKESFIGIEDLVMVDEPFPDEVVSSPIMIKGAARGSWFFEGSAPIELVDDKGKIIAKKYISAEGDWMTSDFVNYEGELEFETPESENGFLIFRNSNPSVKRELDKEFRIPIKFE